MRYTINDEADFLLGLDTLYQKSNKKRFFDLMKEVTEMLNPFFQKLIEQKVIDRGDYRYRACEEVMFDRFGERHTVTAIEKMVIPAFKEFGVIGHSVDTIGFIENDTFYCKCIFYKKLGWY